MMAKRRTSRNVWLVTGVVFAVLILGCAFGIYRYLDSRVARVDWRPIATRGKLEQPIGGGEMETVAFLRQVGFEDQYIRIQRRSADHLLAGRLVAIQAWIPQRGGGYTRPKTILAYCDFADDERLNGCNIAPGDPQLAPSRFVETTPVSTP